MLNRIMLSFYGLIFSVLAFAGVANAVSLGKIDVASHLGEPFYAEVPLSLDEGESISSVYVELAEPADYRILEVYRDQALNSIRADVENDSRGTRVELTSRSAMDAPFFNLVLKVRYGRATHYKKYPVFLDLPRAAQPVKQSAPLPTVKVEDAAMAPEVTAVVPVQQMASEPEMAAEEETSAQAFEPFDGWARISHYGPMVYGDTISTVAERLRVDDRYTRNQVMVALFEKNRSKFEQDNINLIQAGTHLDIPAAAEVERIRPAEAANVLKEHNQRWRELVKQPRYAAVKEAQETRYSKRVRIGKNATGAASAPMAAQESEGGMGEKSQADAPSSATAMEEGSVTGSEDGSGGAEAAMLSETVAKLQEENATLQAKLAETDAKLAQLSAGGPADAQVAAEARIKKLELQLARLQSELDTARQSAVESSGPDWMMLAGGGLVILLLGGGAGYLLRRERKHPAMMAEPAVEAFDMDDAAASVPDMPEEAPEEIEVEAVDDFSSDSTEQMNADDFEDAFSDSIPDLTDEETGEMEAFTQDIEEEPDPNVDYLSEADVYMRYGMEDEAEKQVEMALKIKENNPDAHAKLVQVRKAKGDEAGADEAMATARNLLSADLLSSFESTVASLTTGGTTAEAASLDDTLPPGALDVSSDPQVDEGLDSATADESSELSDIEFGDEEVSLTDAEETMVETPDASETLELGDLEWPGSDPAEEEAEAAPAEKPAEEPVAEVAGEDAGDSEDANGSDGLDFDLSGLELPDEDSSSDADTQNEDDAAPLMETGEEIEASDQPAEQAEVMDDDGLNLSELDLGDENEIDISAADENGGSDEEMMTADLDKTVVMDWSKETLSSDEHNIGGESGADEISFDDEEPAATDDALSFDEAVTEEPVAEEPVAEEPVAEEPVAEEPVAAPVDKSAGSLEEKDDEPAEHLSSVEFDLEDLDVDLDASSSSDDPDDFSSTIQTHVGDIGVSDDSQEDKSKSLDDAVSEADDLGLEPLDESKDDDSISADGLGESLDLSDNDSLENLIEKSDDKDFDATLELDSLLSQLGDLDEDEEKKDS